MSENLLPTNATAWERGLANGLDEWALLDNAIASIRTAKLVTPPPDFLPFLVYEYGLGELTPYVPSLYQLLGEGVRWQRVRGTPASIEMGLGWLDYAGRLEEESHYRRHWNMLQLELDRVRDAVADLARLAGVTQLSLPKRSTFWRGFHGFDIRPLTYGEKHWSGSHWSQHSGVRIGGAGPLWSFGRDYRFARVLDETELTALGVWVEVNPIEWLEGNIGWGDFPWQNSEATWQASLALARSQAMATSTMSLPVLVGFYADGEPIGYRRPRVRRFVHADGDGSYQTPFGTFAASAGQDRFVYVEALTAFGDGNGRKADSAAVVFGLSPAPGVPAGRAWLDPDQVTGSAIAVAQMPVDISFGESIRERVAFLLDFDGPIGGELPELPEGAKFVVSRTGKVLTAPNGKPYILQGA